MLISFFFSSSVLVTHTDAVKISDFGTSKELSDKSTKMSFAGTVAWMAPEVIRNEPVSEKVDIWWVVLMFKYLHLLFSHLVSQHFTYSALFSHPKHEDSLLCGGLSLSPSAECPELCYWTMGYNGKRNYIHAQKLGVEIWKYLMRLSADYLVSCSKQMQCFFPVLLVRLELSSAPGTQGCLSNFCSQGIFHLLSTLFRATLEL